jgi:hypothetical protein
MRINYFSKLTDIYRNALITLGLTAESGEGYYAELDDYDSDDLSDWFTENKISSGVITCSFGRNSQG